MRLAVDAAFTRMEEVAIEIIKQHKGRAYSTLDDGEKSVVSGVHELHKAAIEKMLNTYETCCASYLDGKVDPERFKRNFHIEIRNIVEDKQSRIAEVREQPPQTKFKNIFIVYEKWHNLELQPNVST